MMKVYFLTYPYTLSSEISDGFFEKFQELVSCYRVYAAWTRDVDTDSLSRFEGTLKGLIEYEKRKQI